MKQTTLPLCLSRYFFLIWEFLVYIPDKCRHQSGPGGCLPRHLGKWYYYLTGCAILLMQASFLILRNNSFVFLAKIPLFSLHSITCTTFLHSSSCLPFFLRRVFQALRQFFERVSWELSYPLLFCSCPDQACAERRRRTIVPSCSHQERHKASCLELRRTCRSDALCRWATLVRPY